MDRCCAIIDQNILRVRKLLVTKPSIELNLSTHVTCHVARKGLSESLAIHRACAVRTTGFADNLRCSQEHSTWETCVIALT